VRVGGLRTGVSWFSNSDMSYEKLDRHDEPSEAQTQDPQDEPREEEGGQEAEPRPAFPPRGTALSVLWLSPADAGDLEPSATEERARAHAATRANARR